jgi:hypothetical protein
LMKTLWCLNMRCKPKDVPNLAWWPTLLWKAAVVGRQSPW